MLLYDRVYDRALKLTASSLLILILALIPVSAFAVEESAEVNHDVIIIGAGAAGQYAAYELDYLGFDVLVLEARPRRFGMLHPPQTVGSNPTQVTPIAEGVTGTNNWHYDDIDALDENILVPILAESVDDDALYRIDGTTILGDLITKGEQPGTLRLLGFLLRLGRRLHGSRQSRHRHGNLCLRHPRRLPRYPGDPQDPPHVAFNYYKGNYPGGEWLTGLENIGARSLADQEKLWDLGGGEWGFAHSSWTDTLDELYFDQIVDKVS